MRPWTLERFFVSVQPELLAVVMVNGHGVPKSHILKQCDKVKLLPFMAGGSSQEHRQQPFRFLL